MHEALQRARPARHPARPAPGPAGADPGAAAGRPSRGRSAVWQRAYYGAGVAAYDAFAGVVRRRPGHAAAPAPDPRRRPAALPVAARRHDRRRDPLLRRPGRRRPAGGRRWPAPRPASARPSSPAPGSSASSARPARSPASGSATWRRPAEEFEVRARTVVAATGVWSDDMSRDAAATSASGPACGCAPPRACTWWCPARRSPARPG